MRTFTHASHFPVSPDALMSFHARPDAFARLVMPPLVVQILRDDRTSLQNGEIEFRMWFGPVPVRWLAQHQPGPGPDSFTDVQVRGPLQHWVHEHLIEAAPGGSRLTDRITFEHRPGLPGILTRLLFDGLPLRLLFVYRHWQTRRLLRRTPAAENAVPAAGIDPESSQIGGSDETRFEKSLRRG